MAFLLSVVLNSLFLFRLQDAERPCRHSAASRRNDKTSRTGLQTPSGRENVTDGVANWGVKSDVVLLSFFHPTFVPLEIYLTATKLKKSDPSMSSLGTKRRQAFSKNRISTFGPKIG
jgi:hypothetical protein